MPAPTLALSAPPPRNFFDPGILRPRALIRWSGGTGPFDVLHEWDTVNTFDSGNLIQDSNTGATSPDEGIPPSDMGPAGTTWFYRVTVTDTDDSTSSTSGTQTLNWTDPQDFDRYLYLLANVGVGFTPTDDPAGGWGAAGTIGPDGDTQDFDRYLYLLANVGVGFDPTDTPAGGWGPGGAPGDGYTIDFDRYLYLLANVTTTTPTPHIWFVFPSFGREGWEFKIIGYGFGDTQGTYSGSATLNGLAVGVISWQLIAEVGSGMEIDPQTALANPVHQEIRATVPTGGESGLIIVCTDGP